MRRPHSNSLLASLARLAPLPDHERLVMATLQRYGRSNVAQLARLTGLPAPRVREALDALERTEQVESVAVGPGLLYAVAPGGLVSLGEPRFAWGPIVPLFRQFNLLCDRSRVEAIEAAIEAVVMPGDVVYDLGCGVGLLTLIAARRGARVFAVEVDPFVARAAEYFLKSELDPEQFTLIVGDALRFTPPRRADVIVCEMLDTGLISEMQVQVMNRAIRDLLEPGGRVLPRSAMTTVAATDVDFNVGRFEFALPHFDAADTNRVRARLSAPVAVHEADFAFENATRVSTACALAIERACRVNSVCLETSVDFGDGRVATGSPWLDPPLILPVVPVVFDEPGMLEVRLDYELGGALTDVRVDVRSATQGGVAR